MKFITWFSTHLALESLFIWVFIGSNLRDNYLKSRKNSSLFLITSLAALGPDFDYLIRMLTDWIPGATSIFNIFYHRGATHSIFIPLLFILIGICIISYYNYKHPNQASNSDFSFQKLLGYSFLLASIFWGMHLLLDIDSAEGGMALFWPLDNGIYQPKILINLLAYPFFLLPWTPLGLNVDVEYSTLQSLQGYLLNWTPEQIIFYFGKPEFPLYLAGLILHLTIFLVYINFVLKPLILGLRINRPTKFSLIQEIFRKISRYSRKIPKYIFVSSIVFILIGYSLGPMLGSELHDFQTTRSTLNFTGSSFSPSTKINYEHLNQPLDSQAQNEFDLNITKLEVDNTTLAIIISPHNIFQDWEDKIESEFSKTGNLNSIINSTDKNFKDFYRQSVMDLLSDQSIIFSMIEITEPVNISNIKNNANQKISIGIILYDWISASSWNKTDVSSYIEYSVSIIIQRNVNFIIGLIIESIGFIILIITLVKPIVNNNKELTKNQKNF